MFRQVEPFDFVLLGDSQAHGGVEDLQEDKRGDRGEDPCDEDGNDLPYQDAATFEQSERRAVPGDIPASVTCDPQVYAASCGEWAV